MAGTAPTDVGRSHPDSPAHWSDRTVQANLPALERVLPPDVLPLRSPDGGLAALGCGRWGCVYRTWRPDIVFKLTTDATEARFIATALQLPRQPSGIVRYHFIAKMHGMVAAPMDNFAQPRSAYAVIREAASDIGRFKPDPGEDSADARDRASAVVGMRLFKEAANFIREAMRVQRDDGVQLLGEAAVLLKAHRMEPSVVRADEKYAPVWQRKLDIQPSDPVIVLDDHEDTAAHVARMHTLLEWTSDFVGGLAATAELGRALRQYLDWGLMLCDVHFKNVGRVARSGRKVWAITDPGHAMRLRSDIPDPVIATLPG